MSRLLLAIILGALLTACEKTFPPSCIGSLADQKVSVKSLCRDLLKNQLDPSAALEVILSGGFNSRDGAKIVEGVNAGPRNCLNVVKKQCELIELRNGVGY